jgi:hypothetical protein
MLLKACYNGSHKIKGLKLTVAPVKIQNEAFSPKPLQAKFSSCMTLFSAGENKVDY